MGRKASRDLWVYRKLLLSSAESLKENVNRHYAMELHDDFVTVLECEIAAS